MTPIDILIWTATLVFVASALITVLALIGVITLGGGNGDKHNYYLNRLVNVLMVEIVVVSVGAFANYVQTESDFSELIGTAQVSTQNTSTQEEQ